MNKLELRLQALIEAREKRTGRKLDDAEREEVRAFAADTLDEATPGLANLLDQVEEAGLLLDDGTLDMESLELLAAAALDDGDEGDEEGDEGDDEEVSEEEVMEAISQMGPEELVEFLADNFSDEELAEMEEAEYLASEEQFIPQEQFVQQRAFSGADEVDVEALLAQAREEAREEAQLAMETERRSFALAADVDDQEDFVNELVMTGRLAPALRDATHAALIASVSVGGETRSFAAADLGDYGDNSLTALLRHVLGNLPVQPGFNPLTVDYGVQSRSFSAQDFESINDPSVATRVGNAVRARMKETNENYGTAYGALRDIARGN